MALPASGQLAISQIATEFGDTQPNSLSEFYRGGGKVPNTPVNAAVPASGQISIGNFYGTANRSSINLTISANAYNYDVYTNRGPAYVAGASDITVTVNPGVTVGSTSTGTYAMSVPSAFNPGDTITIVNNGTIQGMGGAGGSGGAAATSSNGFPGSPGGTGGSALYVNRPVTVTNNGTMAAGGGGGGGGGGAIEIGPKFNGAASGGGGGGGAGYDGGGAGSGGPASAANVYRGANGGAGNTTSAGGGGAATPTGPFAPFFYGGPGGAGGGRGAAGSGGGTASSSSMGPATRPGGSGGAAGNYIVGNPFVTWPATGTRQGNVA